MNKTRDERAAKLEAWANEVEAEDLREANTQALRRIVEIVGQQRQLEAELEQAVKAARAANRSWSEIGAMLGVSKQAAQQKYRQTAGA